MGTAGNASTKGKTGYRHTWDENLSRLKEFKKEFNDTNVPQKNNDPKNKKYPSLNHWVLSQRHSRHRLTPEKRQQLEAIDFQWARNTSNSRTDNRNKKDPNKGDCIVDQEQKKKTRTKKTNKQCSSNVMEYTEGSRIRGNYF